MASYSSLPQRRRQFNSYINKSLNADGKLVNKTSDLIDFISVSVLDTACLAYAYYNDYSLTGDIAFTNIYQIKSKALSYAFVNTNIKTFFINIINDYNRSGYNNIKCSFNTFFRLYIDTNLWQIYAICCTMNK